MKVINLFAGPGTGKTTLCYELLAAMKKQGLRVEHVRDIPREEVYWESWRELDDHLIQLAKIQSAINMHRPHCDYLVVESPVLMRLAYLPTVNERQPMNGEKAISQLALALHQQEDNLDVLLVRNPEFGYDQRGRDQNEAQALERSRITEDIVARHAPSHLRVMAGKDGIDSILQALDIGGLEHKPSTTAGLVEGPARLSYIQTIPYIGRVVHQVEWDRNVKTHWERISSRAIPFEKALLQTIGQEFKRYNLPEGSIEIQYNAESMHCSVLGAHTNFKHSPPLQEIMANVLQKMGTSAGLHTSVSPIRMVDHDGELTPAESPGL